jgi:hypothetical protein
VGASDRRSAAVAVACREDKDYREMRFVAAAASDAQRLARLRGHHPRSDSGGRSADPERLVATVAVAVAAWCRRLAGRSWCRTLSTSRFVSRSAN